MSSSAASLPLTLQPYFLSSFALLPTLLYINKVLLLLATFPTKLNDHYSLLASSLAAFVGLAHAGGILVNIILGETISLNNKSVLIYSTLWLLFTYSKWFRILVVERIYGNRGFVFVRFLLIVFNQYNRAVAVLQRENSFEKIPGFIQGTENLIGVALLATLASNTGTLVASTLRPRLYRSYRPKPTDFNSVLWIFFLMLWYGLCREWGAGNSLLSFLASVAASYGLSSVVEVLQSVKWTAQDDVVVGYLIYPFISLAFGFCVSCFGKRTRLSNETGGQVKLKKR